MKPSTSRRFAAAVLAAAFAAAPLAQALPAYASQSGEVQVTKATDGTYSIYQLFTGSYANGKFGDIAINTEYKNALVAAIRTFDSGFALSGSEDAQAAQIAQALSELDAKQLQSLANKLASSLTGIPAVQAASQNGTVNFGTLEEGYYVVISNEENVVKTSAILIPVTSAGVTVELKATVPTVTKTADKTDVGIIDGAVNAPTYTIEGTVASNVGDYDFYTYSFKDTLPAGLTTTAEEVQTRWNVSITAGQTDLTSAFVTEVTDGHVITWRTSNLKAILPTLDASTVITLKYTPIYDEDDIQALYGTQSTGPVTNSVSLTYSNNPYTSGTGETDSTPSDDVDVNSYNLVIQKVDAKGQSLSGAEFTLTSEGLAQGKQIAADENGQFVFTGLESGKLYTLTESKVPAGYKRIDPITFTINKTGDLISFEEQTDPSSAATFSLESDRTGKVHIINVEGVEMPFTGEAGMIGGLAIGGLILTLSAAAAFRKKEEKE